MGCVYGGQNALLLEFRSFVYEGAEFLRFEDVYFLGRFIYVCMQ